MIFAYTEWEPNGTFEIVRTYPENYIDIYLYQHDYFYFITIRQLIMNNIASLWLGSAICNCGLS
jgi:hypothetical protein